jgi:hypothetical protein
LIDPALESEPVVVGQETEVESEVDVEVVVVVGLEVDVDTDVEMEVEVAVVQDVGLGLDCAKAMSDSPRIRNSDAATTRVANTIQVRANRAIFSARTACRWDRCRHRQRE